MNFFARSKTQTAAPLPPVDPSPNAEALAAMQRGIAEATPGNKKARAPSAAAATPIAPAFQTLAGAKNAPQMMVIPEDLAAINAGIAEAIRVEQKASGPIAPAFQAGAKTLTPAPDILKGAKNAPQIVMVGDDMTGLPEIVRETFDDDYAGLHRRGDNKVYVAMGMSPKETAFTAYHEMAGHYGLQGALGKDYEAVLSRAIQNPMIKEIARAKLKSYGSTATEPGAGMADEVLADLAAAQRTGDYGRVESEWGVKIPDSAKPGIRGMLSRVVQLTKRKLADLIGEEPEAFDDEQVYSLIADAWRYVKRARPSNAEEDDEAAAMLRAIAEADRADAAAKRRPADKGAGAKSAPQVQAAETLPALGDW